MHLRCEVPTPGVIDDAAALIGRPEVRLLSLMDHTPGQRQFRDPVKLRDYYRGKSGGMSDAELDALFARRIENHARFAAENYQGLIALAARHRAPLASHDDTIVDHVEDAVRDRVAVAEFPTTMEAAVALHGAGIKVLMGAPNLVRGGSHSGNIATGELARAGVLDIMSSDYVPSSLLIAALRLPAEAGNFDLAGRDPHRQQNAGRSHRSDRPRRDLRWQACRSHSRPSGRQGHGGLQRLVRRQPRRMIGPGRLVLVVGPSGAGKDTLLSGARALCRDNAEICFARRVVTRPSSDAEDHDSIDEAAFGDATARGLFAFCWQAHGHHYGIPRGINDGHPGWTHGRVQCFTRGRADTANDLRKHLRRIDHGAGGYSCATTGGTRAPDRRSRRPASRAQ